ncbi:NAD(P)-dependent oxidoreductase [bacterium]|nr:MAG: NAD(P)-dependent oxidoreductase [bacterium]
MKIVVTGSESFIARELIAQCKQAGIMVVGFDLVEKPSSDYEFHKADIRSPKLADEIPEGVDAIVHLAALSRDLDCRGRAYECFDANVMGTLNMMNVAAKRNAKQIIFASSEWVYDRFEENEEKDEDAMINIANHTSEYALSKLVSEANLRQRYAQGFLAVTILRFGIIYGPRKSNWGAVESLMSAVRNQSEVTVGSLKNGRRFVHVSDICRGIIQSIGLPDFNVINLSGNRIITLKEVIETAERVTGKKVKIIESNPGQVSVRNPSNKRAKEILRWQPQIDLETGLKTLLPFV